MMILASRYKGDKSQLSGEDQFLMKLMEVPRLNDRLDIVIWASDFPLRFDELAPVVNKCYDLFYQLLQSTRFEKALMYALSIGNYVNSGTNRGGAHGVKISSLAKLADAKSQTQKGTSLMDFFV